jgi:hypothetical protein
VLPIVEPGAAELLVGEREAQRLDEIDGDAEARRQPQDRAGVLRNVGLEERDAKIRGQRTDAGDQRTDQRLQMLEVGALILSQLSSSVLCPLSIALCSCGTVSH